ncbi:MAG: hypothetical protein KDB14_07350 [Planctomycetales bacterium]|nr:hypothetical protein [Planctomycetales bacterium]
MTNIDQFESVFKAAERPLFELEAVDIETILVVTDLDPPATERFAAGVQTFLKGLERETTQWKTVDGNEYDTVGELLQKVGESRCDLVCLYRNLRMPAREYPYSLGVHVDVLTQASSLPVLLMPHPAHLETMPQLQPARHVMAITDHLTGDHHLVSFAAHCTPDDGKLLLTHVEDQVAFDRYLDVIGKVPSIDTEDAREAILSRLLKEPADYIDSATEVLRESRPGLQVEKVVTLGHHLTDHRRLIEDHAVDLLVLNTKDADQLAMHGLAYPLTVELRMTPMLLL